MATKSKKVYVKDINESNITAGQQMMFGELPPDILAKANSVTFDRKPDYYTTEYGEAGEVTKKLVKGAVTPAKGQGIKAIGQYTPTGPGADADQAYSQSYVKDLGTVNGIRVYANYDAQGKLTGFDEGQTKSPTLKPTKIYETDKQYIRPKWDATGKATPVKGVDTKNGGLFSDFFSDVTSGFDDLVLQNPALRAAALAAAVPAITGSGAAGADMGGDVLGADMGAGGGTEAFTGGGIQATPGGGLDLASTTGAPSISSGGINIADMGGAQGLTIPGAEGGMLGAAGLSAATGATAAGLGSGLGLNEAATGTGSMLSGTAAAGAGAAATGALTGNAITDAALIKGATSLAGGLLQGGTTKDALTSDATARANLANEVKNMGKFTPVGITTTFGTSNFVTDPVTGAITPSYTLSPTAKAYQDSLGALGTTALTSAQNIMNLGNQYIGESPEAVRQRYINTQASLLAPGQEAELAKIRNNLANTGRGGLSFGATSDGMAATNPELAAYYNSLAMTNRKLAADAETQYQNQVNFGTGLLGGATTPFTNVFNAQKSVEAQAQQPLTLSTDFANTVATRGAAQGANYANAMNPSLQSTYKASSMNPLADFLQSMSSDDLLALGLAKVIKP